MDAFQVRVRWESDCCKSFTHKWIEIDCEKINSYKGREKEKHNGNMDGQMIAHRDVRLDKG